MLADFVSSNRDAIIAGTQTRVASRTAPKPSDMELKNGIPLFLDQLADALRLAALGEVTNHEEMNKSAGKHGHDLLRMGLTIGQVVHDYGDVCQTITALAVEQEVPISTDEFRTLNLCLDDAIAEAVTTFSSFRERRIADQESERLGLLAQQLRSSLFAAMLSFDMIKTGRVAVGGSTGLVLGRSLLGLRDIIDRSLTEVRLDAGVNGLAARGRSRANGAISCSRHVEARFALRMRALRDFYHGLLVLISVAELIEEIEIGASLQAQVQDLRFSVTTVARTVTIEGDRQIVAAAVSNLLQNAFKFTRQHGTVSLTVRATVNRVLFEVQDECGGLPPGKPEGLVRSFAPDGHDHSGLGTGLTICRKAAQAFAGELYVRDLPGKGCVFTLDLPRKSPPPLLVIGGEKGSEGSLRAASGTDSQRPEKGTPKAQAI